MTAPIERIVTERPPQFPARTPELRDAIERQIQGQLARLEGAPDLEADLEAYHGGGTAWYISSGTAALSAVMLGYGVGPGDEVVTTPYTWGATVAAILSIGAIPVFADIDPFSGLIDPETIAPVLTSRTKAILCVHLFGQVCDMHALKDVADRHGLLLFEDGSQAHGARLDGKVIGLFGQGSGFSCMGSKILAGTEGGYALFADPHAAEAAFPYGRHPRGMSEEQQARLREQGMLDTLVMGWRPCAFGSAMVKANLPFLDAQVAARRRNAKRLRDGLAGAPGIRVAEEIPGAEGAWHMFSLIYDPSVTGVSRDQFIERSRAYGSGGFDYIGEPLHRAYRLNAAKYKGPRVYWHDQLLRHGIDYSQVHCPQADWRSAHSIEIGFNWTEDNPLAMEQIATGFRKAAQI